MTETPPPGYMTDENEPVSPSSSSVSPAGGGLGGGGAGGSDYPSPIGTHGTGGSHTTSRTVRWMDHNCDACTYAPMTVFTVHAFFGVQIRNSLITKGDH